VDCPFTTTTTPIDTKETKQDQNYKASWKPLQLLSVAILREYLSHEFQFQHSTVSVGFPSSVFCTLSFFFFNFQIFRPNLERCIDDFVLMCFLVGNDFLPHLPSLSIHKGSIDQMLLLYEKVLLQKKSVV
jgi:5'-3' exoribonuclease 2